MCQKKPGNRCSGHALKKLHGAEESFNSFLRQMRDENKSIDNLAGKELDQYLALEKKLADARRDYNSTPEGRRALDMKRNAALNQSNYELHEKYDRELYYAQKLWDRRAESLREIENEQERIKSNISLQKRFINEALRSVKDAPYGSPERQQYASQRRNLAAQAMKLHETRNRQISQLLLENAPDEEVRTKVLEAKGAWRKHYFFTLQAEVVQQE